MHKNSHEVSRIGYDTFLKGSFLAAPVPRLSPAAIFVATQNDTFIGHSSSNLADPVENLQD